MKKLKGNVRALEIRVICDDGTQWAVPVGSARMTAFLDAARAVLAMLPEQAGTPSAEDHGASCATTAGNTVFLDELLADFVKKWPLREVEKMGHLSLRHAKQTFDWLRVQVDLLGLGHLKGGGFEIPDLTDITVGIRNEGFHKEALRSGRVRDWR